MKAYPKIEYYNKGLFGENIIAFDKLDGQNFRAEYSRKRGFYKYGTRTTMIDKNDDTFGKCIPLFLDKYSETLCKIFTDKYKKVDSFVVFGEYVGENSFSGIHDTNDIMDIVLFDVNQYKRGFIPPNEFYTNFGHLDIPKIIYRGIYTEEFIQDIKSNKYNLKEGVVAKGTFKNKNNKEEIWSVKIKCNHWLERIKNKLGEKALLSELNGDISLFNNIKI